MDAVEFRPPRALGVIVAGAISLWAFGVAALLVSIALGSAPEPATLAAWACAALAIAVGLAFVHWAHALSTLTYTIGGGSLTIHWGFRGVVVPIEDIQRMAPGRTVESIHVRGLNWWGCHIGRADTERFGPTRVYSTHSGPGDLLYVVTPQGTYGVTVGDHAHFAEAVQRRSVPGPSQARSQRSLVHGPAALPIWRDRVARASIGFGLLGCLLLAAYSFAQYPNLPDVIQLDFPESGGIVRIGDKDELLRIPAFGAVVLAFNTAVGVAIHSRERAAAIWLFGAGGLLQFVLVIAWVIAYRAA